jgi:ABC-type Fe3+/spermidine/putrescine transport system ATPase subunit
MSEEESQKTVPLLEVRNLELRNGGSVLLSGLNLELHASELAGLSGPSGCGKTTLLRVIAGIIDGHTGRIRYRGKAAGEDGWPVYRRRVLLLAQRPALLNLSVRENLARPFAYKSAEQEFPEDHARALLDRLRLEDVAFGKNARQLSEGQQQRVCLARSLLLEPEVLLLDEPASALDADAVSAVEEELKERVQSSGCTALVVSHSREQLGRWCGRIIDLAAYMPGEKP